MKGIKRLDWYIMGKFLGTFFLSLLLIIGIVIIFDISEKIDDFVAKEAPLKSIIVRNPFMRCQLSQDDGALSCYGYHYSPHVSVAQPLGDS